jgi:hypothetical protein
MNTINGAIDARILEAIQATGSTALTSKQVQCWLSCSSGVARAALARLEREGFLVVERHHITGWQKAGPGSGKSPITHKTRLEYRVTHRAANLAALYRVNGGAV